MAIGSHNILSKVDRAIAAYLVSEGIDAASVFSGKMSSDKAAPIVIVFAERATLPHAPTASYEVTVNVMVRTDPSVDVGETAAERKDVSEELVTQVFDAMFKGLESSGHALAEAITDAARGTADADLAGFTVVDIMPDSVEAGFEPKGNAWLDTLVMKATCCPANVS